VLSSELAIGDVNVMKLPQLTAMLVLECITMATISPAKYLKARTETAITTEKL
jgi:hypothetical protein